MELSGESGGHCDCCGSTTKRIWGWVHQGDATLAAFFVGWTEGRSDHDQAFDLVVGRWGDSTTPDERHSVALDFRGQQNAFTVVDAANRIANKPSLASTALRRDEVIGTPLASQVFAIVDAIFVATKALRQSG